MTSRDPHVTPRPIPAQLRPAHDINLPFYFLSSSPIRHGVCHSDRTAITSFVESNPLDFLGNVPFCWRGEWPGVCVPAHPAQSRADLQPRP